MRLIVYLLFALVLMTSANAAVLVDTNPNGTAITRTATVSNTATFFKVDPNRETVVEVSGTGVGTLKVSTDYSAPPSTFNGFTPDSAGSVSSNTGWRFPKGLSYVGFDAASGTWTVRVAQPE